MSRRSRFFIDIALLVGLLVANAPARTGLAVHEWLSIALIVPLLVHLVINWEWTVHVTKRFFERLFSVSRLNLVVDVALFVSTVAVMVSGLAVSSVLAGMSRHRERGHPLWVAVHADIRLGDDRPAAGALRPARRLVRADDHLDVRGSRQHRRGRPCSGARTLQNTLSVLVVTVALAAAMFVTVGGTGALLGLRSARRPPRRPWPAHLDTGDAHLLRAPGCTASSCHAETGQSPYGN